MGVIVPSAHSHYGSLPGTCPVAQDLPNRSVAYQASVGFGRATKLPRCYRTIGQPTKWLPKGARLGIRAMYVEIAPGMLRVCSGYAPVSHHGDRVCKGLLNTEKQIMNQDYRN